MTDFLVIYKPSPDAPPTDWRVCGVIQGKKKSEGETAIEEAMTQGPGTYVATSFDDAVTREGKTVVVLSEPEPEGE